MIQKAKRLCSAILSLCLIICFVADIPVWAEEPEEEMEKEYNGWYYYVEGEEITISGCSYYDEEELELPSEIEGKPVTCIGDYVFAGRESMTKITLPSGLTSIGYGAFSDCSSLKKINLPNGLTSIGYEAFTGCSSLTSIEVAEGSEVYSSREGLLCNADGTELICCPAGKTGAITVPQGIESIQWDAFTGCDLLTEITLPASAIELDATLFNNCSALENITVAEASEMYSSREGIWYNKDVTELICCPKGKTEATIPKTVESIVDEAFLGCKLLTEINVDEESKFYSSKEGILYNKEATELICCPAGKTGVVTIPEGIESIQWTAFTDCSLLTGITFPTSVTELDSAMLSSCSSLEKITVVKGSEFYSSKKGILYNQAGTELLCCPAGKIEVSIPEGVTAIGDYAFENCRKLRAVEIPNSVETIGEEAFLGCDLLTIYGEENSYAQEWAEENWLPFKTGKKPEFWGEWEYRVLEDDTVEIAGYHETEEENFVEIPSMIDGKSVTSIGESAFFNCEFLREIAIPSGVKEIKDFAFAKDWGYFENIEIPSSVESIGEGAFQGSEDMLTIYGEEGSYAQKWAEKAAAFEFKFGKMPRKWENLKYRELEDGTVEIVGYYGEEVALKIPDTIHDMSVISIGDSAFEYCDSLENIEIPSSVEYIGENAFLGCDYLTIYGEAGSYAQKYAEGNDIPFKNETMRVPEQWKNWRYWELEDGTIEIVRYYGEEASIEIPSIILDKQVTKIGNRAFHDCELFTDIIIPNGVTRIGDAAFTGCYSLESIEIPSSVENIGEGAFQGCESLVIYGEADSYAQAYAKDNNILFRIGKRPQTMQKWGDWKYYEFQDGTVEIAKYVGEDAVIEIPDTILDKPVTSIGNSAFDSCSSLTNITIPKGITSIRNSAFYNCNSLTKVTFLNETTNIGNWAFGNCSSLVDITLPSRATSIGAGVFSGCSSLKTIKLPDGVTGIGESAFDGCGSLENITIPSGVTSIENCVFQGCSSLKTIALPSGVTNIGESAFDGCGSLESITIPSGVTSIRRLAFSGCSSLTSVTIPKSVESIGDSVFDGCVSLTSISVETGSTLYKTEDGILYNASGTTLICCPKGKKGEIDLPDSVTKIEASAFAGCGELTGITLPAGIKEIGSYAFLGCKKLNTIVIPDGITRIPLAAFSDCQTLESITIPDSVSDIDEGAFHECSALTSIRIPKSVENIDSQAFLGCSALAGIEVEADSQFYSSQDGILYNASGTELILCPSGKSGKIVIPKEVEEISDSAFTGNTLTDIEVEAGSEVYSSKDGILYDISGTYLIQCPGEMGGTVEISKDVIGIDWNAFAFCKSLENIEVEDGSDEYFSKDGVLYSTWNMLILCPRGKSGKIVIPKEIEWIGDSAFDYCNLLEDIEVEDGSEVYSARNGILYDASGTTLILCPGGKSGKVVIPEGVLQIEYGAFVTGGLVTGVEIPSSVISIERSEAFYNSEFVIYGEAGSYAERFAKMYNLNFERMEQPHTHTIVKDEEVAPTCTTAGKREGSHCSVCGKVIQEQEVIPATGHTVVKDKAVAPTCTTEGKEEGSHCSICGKTILAQKPIAKKAHTYKVVITAKATDKKNGIIETKCSTCGSKKSTATIYAASNIKLSKTSFTYNKKNQKPTVTIKDSKGNKLSAANYKITYPKNSKNVGKYTVTVTLQGNYSGTVKLTYQIVPKTTSISKLTAKKKGFTAKWKKQTAQTTGYQVQYSTSSKFKGAKTITVKKNKTISKSIAKLKAGKKYYVRIRTYKTVKVGGKSVKIVSGWSKAKSVKTKK